MSFQIGFDPAELWAARIIDKTRRALLDAYVNARKVNGVRKKDLAKKLGKDPAQITRWLTRPEQLSLKSLGYLAYALECDVEVELVPLYKHQPKSSVSNQPRWCDQNGAAAALQKVPAGAPAGGNVAGGNVQSREPMAA